jgi:3-deoxy-D-manno-octulosonic-acid transferase
MMVVYSVLLTAALILGAPYWLARMATSGRYRAGLAGRLGRVPEGLRAAVAGRRVVWLHAVSVGEVMAATRLIAELQARLPGWVIAVSTTTETGQRLARERLSENPVFFMPLDFAFAVRRYLRLLKPELVVLMESEFWPRLMRECSRIGVPMAVVNARVSDRSLPRYMRLRTLWQPLLGCVSLYLAQSEENAERLRQIGAPADRVRMSGNLKYDVRTNGANSMTALVSSLLPAEAPVLVCGSTLEDEERFLLDAWHEVLGIEPEAVMVLAPRHPDRFKAVAELVWASGFPMLRATEFREEPEQIAPGSVFLLDTIGDLASVYSLATLAFVGGSLIPSGGHNPLEPAQFGVPVIVGPSFENFREIVDAMRADDAIRVTLPEELAKSLLAMFEHREEACAMGERGQKVFEAKAGATRRTVKALLELLDEVAERKR